MSLSFLQRIGKQENASFPLFSSLKPILAGLVMVLISLLALPMVHGATISFNTSSTYLEDSAATVQVSISDENPFSGTLSFSASNLQLGSSQIAITSGGFVGSHYNTTLSITGIDAGVYSLYASLVNSSTSATIATVNNTGTINSSAPQILSSSPSGIVSKDNTILIVQTHEVATCRYSTSNVSYDSMTSFGNTDALRHNQTLTSLTEGAYTYYIRCRDGDGHVMNTSYPLAFTVDVAPTVSISLSDPSPLKAGTIEIELTLSESVSAAPVLQYNYDDSTSKKSVSLTGSGKNWRGYLITTENDNNKVGAFSFTATDSAGNVGTTITSGGIFLVDTTKPNAPTSLKSIVLTNGDVELEWYYDGEDIDYYRIYRSLTSGVQYVDYHDDADVENSTLRYIDTSPADKATYYYRISAVDGAGNEGPLSDEVYATSLSSGSSAASQAAYSSLSSSTAQEEIPRVLPPNLIYHVTDQVKKLDKAILDIESSISFLAEQKDADKSALLAEFAISQKLTDSKAALQDLKAKALELKNHYRTEAELTSALSQLELEQRKVEITTPKDVSLKEKADHVQTTSKEDIANAANYILQSSSLTEKEMKQYLRLNEKNREKVSVTSSIKVVEFIYLDGAKKEKTFIKKSIVADAKEKLQDVVIMEFIPKTVAASVNEITFLTPNYEVVEEDPVVKFGFLNFNPAGEEISYTVDKAVSLEEVKNTKTVTLLSLNALTSPSTGVTGFSIFPSALALGGGHSLFMWGGVVMIMGLLGYYLLFLNGFETISRGARRKMNIIKLTRDVSSLSRKYGGPSPYEGGAKKLPLSESESQLLLHEIYSHVDSAKQNMADNLLPALFTLHSKISQTKERSPESEGLSVHELLNLANFHIQGGNHQKAAQFYRKINALYSSLPKETKTEVYAECARLHGLLKGK